MNLDLVKGIFSHGVATGSLVANSVRDSLINGFEQLNTEPQELYHASFGNLDDIASSSGKGWSINGNMFLRNVKDDTCRNFFIAGNTGSGKTSSIAMTQLLNAWGQSFIVFDPAGSTLPALPYLEKIGYRQYIYDLDDPNSDALNPLNFATSPNEYGKIAAHFARNSGGDKPDFWTISATALLRLLIGITMRQPVQYRTMSTVQRLLLALAVPPAKEGGKPTDRDKLNQLVIKTASNEQFLEYKALVSGAADKTLSSIIMTCQTMLEVFNTPSVARLSSYTTIDIESFRKQPSILVIKVATLNAAFYKPLISTILESILGVFMRKIADPKTDRHCMFIIDECASLALDSLPIICANNRKHYISLALFYQSISQLYNHFGQESGTTVLANCHNKLFLNTDYRTASELENIIGKCTIKDSKGKSSIEPLMPAQNLLTLKRNEAIFLYGNNPYKVKVTPYYEQPFLLQRAKPYTKPQSNIPSTVPLLPL